MHVLCFLLHFLNCGEVQGRNFNLKSLLGLQQSRLAVLEQGAHLILPEEMFDLKLVPIELSVNESANFVQGAVVGKLSNMMQTGWG
ncbi:hypothetical protein B0H16DRAFT_1491838 [Mycena metata]|uniref:Uncharacterized protein n=1 Tax=Mycena metata TaxID=1033252 RepID=A0AAD7P189_9AGAR|nr:hypothetical protein B0H16DRAFT_1491838 [Mycena metata]